MIFLFLFLLILILLLYISKKFPAVKKYQSVIYLLLGIILFMITVRFLSPVLGTLIGTIIGLWPLISNLTNYINVKNNKNNPNSDMSEEQAYEILGLKKEASIEEIHQAYRDKMKLYHPDKGGSLYFSQIITSAKDLLLKYKGKKR